LKAPQTILSARPVVNFSRQHPPFLSPSVLTLDAWRTK
jgi:hypothetical protein